MDVSLLAFVFSWCFSCCDYVWEIETGWIFEYSCAQYWMWIASISVWRVKNDQQEQWAIDQLTLIRSNSNILLKEIEWWVEKFMCCLLYLLGQQYRTYLLNDCRLFTHWPHVVEGGHWIKCKRIPVDWHPICKVCIIFNLNNWIQSWWGIGILLRSTYKFLTIFFSNLKSTL